MNFRVYVKEEFKGAVTSGATQHFKLEFSPSDATNSDPVTADDADAGAVDLSVSALLCGLCITYILLCMVLRVWARARI